MHYSTVTHKGQVTIPVGIRQALSIREGDKVAFTQLNESITITVLHKAELSELFGYLPKSDKALSIEEMK